MDQTRDLPDQVRLAIPIRVRGMSQQNRFFDEQTEINLVTPQIVVARLRNLVDLDSEIHLTNVKTNVGGTFRVIWANTRESNGAYLVGLELLDPEGDLWGTDVLPASAALREPAASVWLECRRCGQTLCTPVPEAESQYVCEGLVLARHCETCKATTPWALTAKPEPVMVEPEPHEAVPAAAAAPTPRPARPQADHRTNGRAPIRLPIRLTRNKYGITIEDICQTQNVSRSGAYFLTGKNYDVGEPVQVILPYKEGDVLIPLPARVVRQDQPKDTYYKGVAIHLGR